MKDKQLMVGRNHRAMRRNQSYKDDYWYDYRINDFPNWNDEGEVTGPIAPEIAKNLDCAHAN